MNDTDPRGRYRALVADRRARGDVLFGDRHLTAPTGQLGRATSELADAHVYVELERTRIHRDGHITAGRLRAFDRLLEHTRRVGEQLAAAARDICDPTVKFDELLQGRRGYGQRKFGDLYLRRDNLQEVLEELADAAIFVGLQADRLRYRGIYEDDIQSVLVAVESTISDLAGDVMRLQTVIADTRASSRIGAPGYAGRRAPGGGALAADRSADARRMRAR